MSSVPSQPAEESFATVTARLRSELVEKRDSYRLWTFPALELEWPDDGMEIWYGEEQGRLDYYVHVVWKPGTLSGRILRYEADLPVFGRDIVVDGDEVRPCAHKRWVEPLPLDDDSEDVLEELRLLPVVLPVPGEHFVKKATYRSEIRNLLAAKGCPFIVELLGRTPGGDLVFPKYPHDLRHAVSSDTLRTVANYKRWLLQIINGVGYLHSIGIIHRDLVIRNILYGEPVVIGDVQGKWCSITHRAPEIVDQTGFSSASDVYAIGMLIWEMCYFNGPPACMKFLDLTVPPPFDKIFAACRQESPVARPTIPQLKAMVEQIPVFD